MAALSSGLDVVTARIADKPFTHGKVANPLAVNTLFGELLEDRPQQVENFFFGNRFPVKLIEPITISAIRAVTTFEPDDKAAVNTGTFGQRANQRHSR